MLPATANPNHHNFRKSQSPSSALVTGTALPMALVEPSATSTSATDAPHSYLTYKEDDREEPWTLPVGYRN
jgi:hypothetical protein